VEDYSPGYEAGIGADDEIIFVNSSRCTSVDELDVLLAKRGENNASELVISSDTGMVTLWLTPKKMPDFALTAREDASEEEKALLERWLQR
jgi:predicted metalloprotease with PDZ domain